MSDDKELTSEEIAFRKHQAESVAQSSGAFWHGNRFIPPPIGSETPSVLDPDVGKVIREEPLSLVKRRGRPKKSIEDINEYMRNL